MSQYFTISLPSSSSPGPYNIYYNFLNSGFLAQIFNTSQFAENISLSQLITGVTVVVPDNTNVIYLYNNSLCDSAQSFPIDPLPPTFDTLCLSYTCGANTVQFDFSWNGDYYNNKPIFSATGGYNLVWVTANTPNYWEVSGLTQPILRSTDVSSPPITNWQGYNLPDCPGGFSVKGIRGICSPDQNLPVLSLFKSDPTCSNLSDGGISINTSGGNPPFTYSLDSVNYFPSPVFPNLPASTYNVFVKDVSGNVVSDLVTLNATPQTNHQFNVNQLAFSQISQVGNTKYYQLNYSITPDLTLPTGSVANINLTIDYNLNYTGPGTPIFVTSGNTLTKNGFTQVPALINSVTPFINGFSPCSPFFNTFTGQDTYFRNFTYQNTDSISGSCIFGIDSFTSGSTSGSCFTNASISLNLTTVVTSVNCDCCNCVGNTLNKNINVSYFSYP